MIFIICDILKRPTVTKIEWIYLHNSVRVFDFREVNEIFIVTTISIIVVAGGARLLLASVAGVR